MWVLLLLSLFTGLCFKGVLLLYSKLICRSRTRLWFPLPGNSKYGSCNKLNLPPGSLGLPILGETLQFFAPNDSFDVPPFVKQRKLRYGPIFKTSLVGRPVVVSTDPDVNQLVFQQEGRLFQSWYPDTFTKVFGEQNVGSIHGHLYKYLRNMVLTLVGPENLKEKLLPEVELNLLAKTRDWHDRVVDIKEATASIIFDLTAKKLISYTYDPQKEAPGTCLRTNFQAFIQGLISFPLNIPGTAYNQCLKGRAKAMAMLNKMLEERREEKPQRKHGDFFDYVVAELDKEGSPLTKEIALDLMFVLLFASFETTSLALTLAIKFLTDHPAALQQLTEEHEAILAKREHKNSNLTWKEYKSMTFTSNVINETLRLANIVPGIFRKAKTEVNIKGYTIPAGWAVMVCPTSLHLDPIVYPDPLAFNPWRWQNMDSNAIAKYFIPFGGGMRFCVGTDFTRLQMAVFLFCLVTKYKWKAVKGGEIRRTPGLSFPNGYHIHLQSKQRTATGNGEL